MPQKQTEEDLWFQEQLLPHEAKLRSWLLHRFPNVRDIDDIIQEAYFKVLKAYNQHEIRSPKSFLYATARNLTINALRHSKVRCENVVVEMDESDVIDNSMTAFEAITRNQEIELLTNAIQSLPERCRQIFTLRKVYGMSQQEIAKKLGLSIHTVYAQTALGLNKCAEYVERYKSENQS